jgi:hypothetical protein
VNKANRGNGVRVVRARNNRRQWRNDSW